MLYVTIYCLATALLRKINSHVCGRPLGLGHKLASRMALCKYIFISPLQTTLYLYCIDLDDLLDTSKGCISFLPVSQCRPIYDQRITPVSNQLLGYSSGPIPALLLRIGPFSANMCKNIRCNLPFLLRFALPRELKLFHVDPGCAGYVEPSRL